MFGSAPTANMINGFEMKMNANGNELRGGGWEMEWRCGTTGSHNAVRHSSLLEIKMKEIRVPKVKNDLRLLDKPWPRWRARTCSAFICSNKYLTCAIRLFQFSVVVHTLRFTPVDYVGMDTLRMRCGSLLWPLLQYSHFSVIYP